MADDTQGNVNTSFKRSKPNSTSTPKQSFKKSEQDVQPLQIEDPSTTPLEEPGYDSEQGLASTKDLIPDNAEQFKKIKIPKKGHEILKVPSQSAQIPEYNPQTMNSSLPDAHLSFESRRSSLQSVSVLQLGTLPGENYVCQRERRPSLGQDNVTFVHDECNDDDNEINMFEDKDDNKLDNKEDKEIKFQDLTTKEKAQKVIITILRFLGLLSLLYFFICSLDLLSSSFTLLGGRSAGGALGNSELLKNPVCGLMIGVVITALLQSSSTSTSIIITMIAAKILTVQVAIPMIMGANIGTSVTGILVSVTQAGDRETFRRAFAAATVHDMFNWLTVIIVLPIEVFTGYLYHLTTAIVEITPLPGGTEAPEFLKVITKPFTGLFVQVDKTVLGLIAAGDPKAANMSMLKYWCKTDYKPPSPALSDAEDVMRRPSMIGSRLSMNMTTTTVSPTEIIGYKPCFYMFHGTHLSEQAVGAILLVISLVMLISCLILMVKILKSLLQGSMANVIQKTINANFPGKAACFTGYVAIFVGAIVTILVQSSSVVASALTPLVGVGLVTVERVYPMMLGANIGTTSTAILAAFAASGDMLKPAFQIALCHLFFNLTGILLWYPLPFMRKVPISMAKFLGKTTARYRWFAVAYLLGVFLILPMLIFGLSIPGWYVLAGVGIPIILLLIAIGIINLLQKHKPNWLPGKLQNWDFLPEWMRSLAPADRLVSKVMNSCCCKCYKKKQSNVEYQNEALEESNDETFQSFFKRASQDGTIQTVSNGNYFISPGQNNPYPFASTYSLSASRADVSSTGVLYESAI